MFEEIKKKDVEYVEKLIKSMTRKKLYNTIMCLVLQLRKIERKVKCERKKTKYQELLLSNVLNGKYE